MLDPAMEREMHELRAKLDVMETTHRRTVSAGDISEDESENEVENEEFVVEDVVEEFLLSLLLG